MGEGPLESCDLESNTGRETSTSELLVLPGRLPAAFSSSQTLDGDHLTKFLSSGIVLSYTL